MRALAAIAVCVAGIAAAEDLTLVPANPTSIDTVRLRWTHVGCTNPNAVQVTQEANRIVVSTDRGFSPGPAVDCGTVNGYFEEFTLGRLPTGEYDVQLS